MPKQIDMPAVKERNYVGLKDELKPKKFYSFIKRAFDIFASLMAIIILSVPMLIVALIIRSDGGPALYKQTRIGKDGKPFKMYKFRSMIMNADSPEILEQLKHLNEMDGPMFKIENDPRITKVGKFIRRASIDELPQLFNILGGSMTVVGPRPPLVSEVKEFDDYQKQKLLVKQGLTCYWQCSGRNNILFDEWIELDLKYIKERGILTDIGIILKTVPAVFSKNGAQ